MGEWTAIEGAMRLRACPEVNELFKKLVEIVGDDAMVVDTADDENYVDLGLDVAEHRAIGTHCKIEECLQEFEPYLKEPAMFSTNTEDIRGEFWLGDRRGVIRKMIKRWQVRAKKAMYASRLLLNELNEIEQAERKAAADGQ